MSTIISNHFSPAVRNLSDHSFILRTKLLHGEKRMDKEMYTDDYTDEISELVEEAHAIFNATTVSEVMDMRDRQLQEDFLNKIYSNPGVEAINSYLDVVKRLRRATYGG
jgi:hypothetical protein